jgi:hypothetical protein
MAGRKWFGTTSTLAVGCTQPRIKLIPLSNSIETKQLELNLTSHIRLLLRLEMCGTLPRKPSWLHRRWWKSLTFLQKILVH